MRKPTEINAAWCEANPLPSVEAGADKNSRGRMLLVGGARFVPGALALTGEAALRAGAGKLQMATVEAVALALGVLVPEAAMVALPMRDDGEIACEAVDPLKALASRCDVLLAGPGMSATSETAELVRGLLGLSQPALVLDAAALTCASLADLSDASARMAIILTPHHGEMARLAGCDTASVEANPASVAARMASQSGATIVLKGPETWIAGRGGALLHYAGGCPGLATGGSGDVLAGIIGGLLARGVAPLAAAGWGVCIHGAAGQAAARAIGQLGFLARDLLPLIPGLLGRPDLRNRSGDMARTLHTDAAR